MAVSDVISFGPYRLIPAQRILLKQEEVVDVGNRAFDILVALAEAAGDVVSQSELIARAWPNVVVGEGSLRVTIAGLRKALGDGQDGVRYISNVTGRGYCFVAQRAFNEIANDFDPPATCLGSSPYLPRQAAGSPCPHDRAGWRGRGIVGVVGFETLCQRGRAGGVGKTTVAVAVAHALLDDSRQAR